MVMDCATVSEPLPTQAAETARKNVEARNSAPTDLNGLEKPEILPELPRVMICPALNHFL
jgi:hypothetical protein